jgi:phage terminase small subunit
MKPETTAPSPPSNPNWHRFANNVIGCKSLVDSYLAAGFQCTKATAYVNASKLRRKPVVAEYIRYWVDREYRQRQEERRSQHQALFRIRF